MGPLEFAQSMVLSIYFSFSRYSLGRFRNNDTIYIFGTRLTWSSLVVDLCIRTYKFRDFLTSSHQQQSAPTRTGTMSDNPESDSQYEADGEWDVIHSRDRVVDPGDQPRSFVASQLSGKATTISFNHYTVNESLEEPTPSTHVQHQRARQAIGGEEKSGTQSFARPPPTSPSCNIVEECTYADGTSVARIETKHGEELAELRGRNITLQERLNIARRLQPVIIFHRAQVGTVCEMHEKLV